VVASLLCFEDFFWFFPEQKITLLSLIAVLRNQSSEDLLQLDGGFLKNEANTEMQPAKIDGPKSCVTITLCGFSSTSDPFLYFVVNETGVKLF
jgi:hypothetical protein